jgi:hypothetical protein
MSEQLAKVAQYAMKIATGEILNNTIDAGQAVLGEATDLSRMQRAKALLKTTKGAVGAAAVGAGLVGAGVYAATRKKEASLEEVAMAKTAAAEMFDDALNKLAFAQDLWDQADNEFIKMASDNGVGELAGHGDQQTAVGAVQAVPDGSTNSAGAMSPGALNAFIEQLRKNRAVGNMPEPKQASSQVMSKEDMNRIEGMAGDFINSKINPLYGVTNFNRTSKDATPAQFGHAVGKNLATIAGATGAAIGGMAGVVAGGSTKEKILRGLLGAGVMGGTAGATGYLAGNVKGRMAKNVYDDMQANP